VFLESWWGYLVVEKVKSPTRKLLGRQICTGVMKILLFCDVNLSKNLSKFIPKVVVILK
jgi:hypothetical protein